MDVIFISTNVTYSFYILFSEFTGTAVFVVAILFWLYLSYLLAVILINTSVPKKEEKVMQKITALIQAPSLLRFKPSVKKGGAWIMQSGAPSSPLGHPFIQHPDI